jgi:hypothetical protein
LKPLIGALAVLLVAGGIAAPFLLRHEKEHKGKDKHPAKRVGVLKRVRQGLGKLKLSSAQESKAKAVLDQTNKQLAELKKSGGSNDDSAPKRRAIFDKMWKQMSKILTPAQEKKLEKRAGRSKQETRFDAAPSSASGAGG